MQVQLEDLGEIYEDNKTIYSNYETYPTINILITIPKIITVKTE